ncbi:MAG TPA: ribonuclease PH [Phycisphaerae bacterium]|nr:ribonuclease PH [Phycisphaerae bacterium]
MGRHDGRRAGELRPVEIVRGYTQFAPGSVLIRWGQTHVLCTACWEEGVPAWKAGRGSGWVTAEYDMLPGSTSERRRRNRYRIDGRTQEIQRLIGRALRAVVDLELLGENTILLDCDVLQADGGTRTASITGAYVAVCDAVKHALREKVIRRSPVTDSIAAVSVGRVKGRTLLDLDYAEDAAAEVDLNVAMTGGGRFVEVQGTGEGATFTGGELDKMVRLAARGIRELQAQQAKALRRRRRP